MTSNCLFHFSCHKAMHTHRYSESEYTHSEMLMRSHMDSKARHTCTPARRGSGHTRVAHGRAPAPAQDPGNHLPALTHSRGKGWMTGEQFVRPFKKKTTHLKKKKKRPLQHPSIAAAALSSTIQWSAQERACEEPPSSQPALLSAETSQLQD